MTALGLFGAVAADPDSQVVQDDLLTPHDPAARYEHASLRRIAFDRWVAGGREWPPPEGLLSAVMGAALGRR
ncbi:hypothetical protein J5Y09_06755 [Roseomonas sp. PWR1]|uniref:Uncharacterized protein n=1 Tax=Roseomonas nitratireducens TaxID=2820810 RepID=A0ABS4ARV3_9PROT|nr:hypothetical protein [Neoroseomonas nitratireducens]MBP0463603.1 hypothetical protein [Neoroseomonas nitratireducens]